MSDWSTGTLFCERLDPAVYGDCCLIALGIRSAGDPVGLDKNRSGATLLGSGSSKPLDETFYESSALAYCGIVGFVDRDAEPIAIVATYLIEC